MSIHRCSQVRGIYSSDWWSIELPSGWSASEGSDCVAFSRGFRAGVLKVSAVRKPDGCIVNADVAEFIGELNQGCLVPVDAEQYFGFTRNCQRDGTFLTEWWLAHGSVLVYFTYERTPDIGSNELDGIRRIVESARIDDLQLDVPSGRLATRL